MGKRLGRKYVESMLKRLNATSADTAGSRSGLKGFDMPAWELQPAKYWGFMDDFLIARGALADNADGALTDDVGDSGSETVWRTNVDGSSDTITLDNSVTGGVLNILNGTSDNDETHMTALNHGFAFDASNPRKIWLECRIKTSDISGTGFFVGLASAGGNEETDGNDLEDACGFYVVDGAASEDLTLLTAKGDTETATSLSHTVVDTTWLVASFYFDGSSIKAYVNGSLKATISSGTSGFPNDGTIVFPAIHVAAREAGANTISIDYMRICMER
tara:strand:- start:26 stop:850 length:825 start_codon:yes stop_codon:yes gene_type:complete